MKHTPGNWAQEYCGKETIKVFKTSDKRRIATIHVKANSRDLDEADAQLIASAPELLDTLKEAEMWIVGTRSYVLGSDHAVAIRNKIQAAIAKAEGAE